MTELYIIGIVLVVIVAGLFVVPMLTKKGIINNEKLGNVIKGLDISRLLVEVIKTEKLDKDKANFILDVADIAVDYVANLYNDKDENKKDIALHAVYSTLDKLNISPLSDAEKRLIEIVIEQGLLFYNKK